MKKISLDELKARSAFVVTNCELMNIAMSSKSPTAAYELVIQKGFDAFVARSCRYLAIIKRDYGERELELFRDKSRASVFQFIISDWIQVAQRLNYLWRFLSRGKNDYKFNESDRGYFCVLKKWYETVLCYKESEVRAKLDESDLVYVGEVKMLLNDAFRCSVNRYSVEKSAHLLFRTISIVCDLNGISLTVLGDKVWDEVPSDIN